METSTFDEENNDTLYIAELVHNNYENYEENKLENDENNNIQNTRVRGRGQGHGQGHSQSHEETHQFSPSPSFNKFQHLRPYKQINTIVKNTNNYNLKDAGEGCKWKNLTIKNFKICIKDYWNKNNKYPEHKITTFMSLLLSILCIFQNEPSKPNTQDHIKKSTQQFKFIQVDLTKKYQYITTNFKLSPLRLTSNGHFPKWREKRSSCVKFYEKSELKKSLKTRKHSSRACTSCTIARCILKSSEQRKFIEYYYRPDGLCASEFAQHYQLLWAVREEMRQANIV
ncbi:hypothetical protein Glove_82g81 [Diversispora epigaea]|uniref:PiggyBac transposable element-derived protein domain-containing protein n=1 Tax=Diversispora epigaea TaxID=1348612 RepID=A0A397J7T9_9GLOM|nr:hypothetical protein Glove_82g81 [Diversispora epigaea]